MGIKFHCPNGHKLNVKAFLGGKRAICPKCGVRVIVPLESEANGQAATNGQSGTAVEALASEQSANASALATHHDMRSAAPAMATTGQPSAGGAAQRLLQDAGVPDAIAEAPNAVWYVRPSSGGQFGPAAGETMRMWILEGRVTANSLVWRAGWPEWRSAAAVFPSLAAGVTGPAFPGTAPVTSHAAHPNLWAGGLAAPVSAAPVSVAPVTLPVGQVVSPVGPVATDTSLLGSTESVVQRRRLRKRQSNTVALLVSIVLVVLAIILIVVLFVVLSGGSSAALRDDVGSNCGLARNADQRRPLANCSLARCAKLQRTAAI